MSSDGDKRKTGMKSANNQQKTARRSNLARKLVIKICSRSVEGIRDEYRAIKRCCDPSLTKEFNKAENMLKNRYKDVPCLDSTRVILKEDGVGAGNYIHANYVSSAMSPKRFICTQGPMSCNAANPRGTAIDFWRMVAQEGCEFIVMLCDVFENGYNKCDQYWPNMCGEKRDYSYITVINKEVSMIACEEAELRVCKLEVSTPYQTVITHHIQWLHWPDRGVPAPSRAPFVLLDVIRGSKKPIVVHCSAGIGRTGSIVMLEIILEQIFTGVPHTPALPDVLEQVRRQRGQSIQTEHQYLYVYRALMMYFHERGLFPEVDEEAERFYREYDEFIAVAGAAAKPAASAPTEDDYFMPEPPRIDAKAIGVCELFKNPGQEAKHGYFEKREKKRPKQEKSGGKKEKEERSGDRHKKEEE